MKQQCGFNTQLKADDQHLQPLTTVKFLQITTSDRSAFAGSFAFLMLVLFVKHSCCFKQKGSHQKTFYLRQKKVP